MLLLYRKLLISVVFFIGLFSSHLVYLLLAVIYIFGCSVYALNCKKQNNCTSNNTVNKILHEDSGLVSEGASYDDSDSFYWFDKDKQSDQDVAQVEPPDGLCFDVPKIIKAKEQDSAQFYDFQLSYYLTTRPPPCCA